MRRRIPVDLGLGLGALLFGFAAEVAFILRLNAGRFTYTLDDPYIHLALAQRIAHGHYGINVLEPAAPSSSILWPFLLAPFARAGFGLYVPLGLGLLSAIGTVVLMRKILATIIPPSDGASKPFLPALALALLIVVTNMIPLIFTGMEHSLQLLLATTVLWGLIREAAAREVTPWMAAAIVLGPLVRYEGLVLSLGAIVYLFGRGHRSAAAMLTVAVLLPLGVFSAFLVRLGLAPLPASVLMRSSVVSTGGSVAAILANLRTALHGSLGTLLAVLLLSHLSFALLSKRENAERALAGLIAFVVAMQLAVGGQGWYYRYESYAWTLAILSGLFLARRPIARAIQGRSALAIAAVATLWSALLCSRFVTGLAALPVAANNIFEQHAQMHRFVVDFYRGPVAINDLGYVAYDNDRYVLDLTGLGSPEALRYAREGDGGRWMDAIARSHGVGCAMIYEDWFPQIPADWRKVGELRLGRKKITAAGSVVSFYGLSPESYERMRKLAMEFRRGLPSGVEFSLAGAR